jgi:nitroreductase
MNLSVNNFLFSGSKTLYHYFCYIFQKKQMLESSEVLEAMRWRYACKKFDAQRKVPQEQIEDVLAILNLTATSLGMQLMKIVVVTNPALKEALFKHSFNQHQVVDCSHVLVLCRYNTVDQTMVEEYVERSVTTRNFDPNSPKIQGFKNMVMSTVSMPEDQRKHWMVNQVYIALGNLLTTCALLKIDSCPMEGFNPSGVDEVLGLSERGLSSVLLCPLGYRHEEDVYAGLPKVRRPISDFVLDLE